MRHVVRNSIILLVVTLIAVALVYPPDQKIRLGKDLRGGTSLVYSVDVAPTDPVGVISSVIEVVKKRLDPNGVMEISIVAQGGERIEITMPLPSRRVKELRQAFEDSLSDLTARSIKPDVLSAALALEPGQRAPRLAELAGSRRPGAGESEQQTLARLEALAAKYDLAVSARKQYDEAARAVREIQQRVRDLETGGVAADDPLLIALRQQALDSAKAAETLGAQTAAPAAIEFESARDEVLKASLSADEVRRALQLSDRPVRKRGDGSKVVQLDSPRQVAMDRIRSDHPGAEATLAKVESAWNAYKAEARTFDDPEDIKRLLRGAGVLNFRITVDPGYRDEENLRAELRRVGPRNAGNEETRWFKINKIDNWVDSVGQLEALRDNAAAYFASRFQIIAEEYLGEYWMLGWDRPGLRLTEADEGWELVGASEGRDQTGRPAIDFQMNTLGGVRLGALTGDNVNRKMAILLDDEVYTAPVLNDRITTRGQISGNFSREELRYIIQVLSAGSLQAKLGKEPISQSTVGPSLGADNLDAGLRAGLIAFMVVAAMMIVYYFGCGLISVIALLLNALLLVAAMSANQAAFTLPGIAGVILTFGMAVDANVLIYERMREEFLRGADMKTAVRLGYSKALSAIVDGNVTTLIVCVVLAFTGTQEIKGFALTLGIGTVTTLFSQLFFTRLVFTVLVEHIGWRRARMLPMVIPAIQRILTPRIDWMSFRYVTLAITVFLTGLSIYLVLSKGRNLLGTEFRGGTVVTLTFADPEGAPVELTRQEVEDRIRERVIDPASADSTLRQILEGGDVIVVNPIDAAGVRSSTFRIRTLLTDSDLVQSELVRAFREEVASKPSLTFEGLAAESIRQAPVFPVISTSLGDSIERPEVRIPVPEFYGGVAVVLDRIFPPASAADIQQRILAMRQQQGFTDLLGREHRVVVLRGTEQAADAAVVLAADPTVSFFDDEQRWESAVRDREWALVKTALGQTTTLASVEKFSPAIAATFRAQALVAVFLSSLLVVVYVWVRFGSFRYSLAAILTTLHDCVVAVGMVALASTLYYKAPGLAGTLKLMPFKIDLNLVAAIMTILGYSLNDTIIILDRVRENRGRLPYAGRAVINNSINQTISRTVMTSGTTLTAVLILYWFGGDGVREFAYTMFIGILVGTYSSVAVAAPLVWVRSADHTHKDTPSSALAAGAAGSASPAVPV